MSFYIIHLPNISNLDKKTILLQPHMVYVGKAISNLAQSSLYHEIPEKAYKQRLWKEIQLQSPIYQALMRLKQFVIVNIDVTLVCSCTHNTNKNSFDCPATSLRQVILYLIEQEKLSNKDESKQLSWQEFTQTVTISEDKIHDFFVWLESNSYATEGLNFPYSWLCFVTDNLSW